MIHFDPNLGWWSPAVFWYVCVSIVLCILFCIVIFIGGWFDLRYLLRSFDEPAVRDNADNAHKP